MWVQCLMLALAASAGLGGAERCGAGGEEGKAPGDNHYRLLVNGDVERYRPDQRYVVTLVGSRTHEVVQSFTRFAVWLEPLDPAQQPSPVRVGQFQLFADTLTKFSDECAREVRAADELPKTEVQVMWKAPPPGAGCVLIKAMVYENASRWFAEDGQLTRRVCEDKAASASHCCACDQAKYQLVFEGLWSPETHPKQFPTQALWLTHFSDVIAASHTANFSFWGEGQIASDGFRSLAEWGSPGLLERELRQRGGGGSGAGAGAVRAVTRAAGLWHPHLNGNTSATLSVDRKRHLVSAASMFGPSPDWVVGVSGLELCRPDCTWEPSKVLELQPYDAGTDSGISYMSPNIETRPREKMYRITPMYPEDPRSPFYNPGGTIAPMARLTLTRQQVIPRPCDDDMLSQLAEETVSSQETDDTPECAVSEWGPWTACSVSCGKGLRLRERRYLSPAGTAHCRRQLVAKEMCVAAVAECPASSDAEEDESLLSPPSPGTEEMCSTSPWGEWGPCSASCGAGLQTRRRHFLNRMAAKKCPLVDVEESRKCMEPPCDAAAAAAAPDPYCPVSQWGPWSPCSAACGGGARYRARLLLVPAQRQRACAGNSSTVEQRPCNEQDCVIDMATAKRICMESPDPGPCRGEFDRWAWVAMKGMCVPFPYGGCRGNRNNFLTREQCTDTCSVLLGASGPLGGSSATGANEVSNSVGGDGRSEADCVVSPWSEWSQCSVSCGVGHQIRTRTVLKPAGEGGAACPTRLSRRRRCSRRC